MPSVVDITSNMSKSHVLVVLLALLFVAPCLTLQARQFHGVTHRVRKLQQDPVAAALQAAEEANRAAQAALEAARAASAAQPPATEQPQQPFAVAVPVVPFPVQQQPITTVQPGGAGQGAIEGAPAPEEMMVSPPGPEEALTIAGPTVTPQEITESVLPERLRLSLANDQPLVP